MKLKIGALLNASVHPRLQWIEVASSLQVPSFQIVGLPAPEISEAKERVRSAIEHSQLSFPLRRIVLNLSPASVRKQGTAVDLALAFAVLSDEYPSPQALNQKLGLEQGPLSEVKVVASGELGLDGTLKPSGQVTRLVLASLEAHADRVFFSVEEKSEALAALTLIQRTRADLRDRRLELVFSRSLLEAWNQLMEREPGPSTAELQDAGGSRADGLGRDAEARDAEARDAEARDAEARDAEARDAEARDAEARDAEARDAELLPLPQLLERAMGVVAAGAHHVLLLGPRGTGKSHALEWLLALQPDILPSIDLENRIVNEISLRGSDRLAGRHRPVRRVGAQAKAPALIGSASSRGILPGEFSRAHGGILIADEFPEWSRDSRESLREPLERGKVTLTRVQGADELPARFLFAGNGNLCPCGGWPPELPMPSADSPIRPKLCRCSAHLRLSYIERLSGPILDRIDVVMQVSALAGRSEPRRADVNGLRARVMQTRERLERRWQTLPGLMSGAQAEELLANHPSWREHLDRTPMTSLRSRHKRLRVALTLAAWDGKDEPETAHFFESALFRPESQGLGL